MLKYITIFDPTRSTNENDTFKELLLYYQFGNAKGNEGITDNEKLSQIGIIQAVWSLTQSFGGSSNDEVEKIIELENNDSILVIKVEGKFFICLCIEGSRDNTDDTNRRRNIIPNQFYLGYLWLCYKIFVMQYDEFANFHDNDNANENNGNTIRKLCGLLNEHFVIFWNNIYLKPETIWKRGFESLWPKHFKNAEFISTSTQNESSTSTSAPNWESMITQNILLEKNGYLGIKDILVYHLPSQNSTSKNQLKLGNKTYGLISNFTTEFEMLPDFSNWLYYLHSVYDELSSHVLAGNAHYKELPPIEGIHSQHRGVDNDEDNNNNTAPNPSSNLTNISSFSNKLFHNLTLPISFALDTVQEIGSTIGISNSVSMYKDYIPSWSSNSNNNISTTTNDENEIAKNSRYGFLISPLCSDKLPLNYKRLQLKLKYSNEIAKLYNCLFWYMNDILIVIICDTSFEKIWDHEYLKDLSFKLLQSMENFHNEYILNATSSSSSLSSSAVESFAYTVVQKKSLNIKSSIPRCSGSRMMMDSMRENDSPLMLVIQEIDQIFNTTNPDSRGASNNSSSGNKWGLDIMGGLFKFHSKDTNNINTITEASEEGENNQISKGQKRLYRNFLDNISEDKLWELHLKITDFLNMIKNSQKKSGIVEERLLRLGNGLLCYIRDDHDRLVIIISNWFEMDEKRTRLFTRGDSDEDTLLRSLGKDVMEWWDATTT
ncbi:Ccz1p NDAI_0A08180 [Naumovozyma dairenensis CBS 421]|uniref:CCZ1/INTU/HSP4 first Longin domain-containing protein n=1 Tax=Naumovozyma dairenensis (strain ATCC 10597 / BCRC 20456 / CBS 421 / NBRC 0211 / NRRL Y-12639) TaxID=1071378 RepID=G0W584_NAUDC|nr:hypothetical protein NDAI_0A08180 [Naumovozyma dairenensis CBS 421]CCD22972.1 hypothetical protein NDAI_0A08180 [Naumovozyma dairenensis CBS 421]